MEADELQELWDAFLAIIQRSRSTQFWVIIDALDELDSISRKDAICQLNRALENDIVGRLKVLFTDRRGPRHDFQNLAIIELGACESREDVSHYIRRKIEGVDQEFAIGRKV